MTEPTESEARKLRAAPCAWIVTRTIKETYSGFGRTKEEAIAWVNEKGPGADTVLILTESARKVQNKP